jgi:hypothetical protein
MRTLVLLGVLIVLAGLVLVSRAQSPSTVGVSRYQMYDCAHEGRGAIYRLDTWTGQAWMLTVGKTSEGQSSLAWQEVPENAKPDFPSARK